MLSYHTRQWGVELVVIRVPYRLPILGMGLVNPESNSSMRPTRYEVCILRKPGCDNRCVYETKHHYRKLKKELIVEIMNVGNQLRYQEIFLIIQRMYLRVEFLQLHFQVLYFSRFLLELITQRLINSSGEWAREYWSGKQLGA